MRKLKPIFYILFAIAIIVLVVAIVQRYSHQKKTIKESLEHKLYRVGYISDIEDEEKYITYNNYQDFKEFLNKTEFINTNDNGLNNLRDDYNDAFFDEHNLSVVYVPISNTGIDIHISEVYSQDNKVVVKYDTIIEEEKETMTITDGYIITVSSSKSQEKVIIK